MEPLEPATALREPDTVRLEPAMEALEPDTEPLEPATALREPDTEPQRTRHSQAPRHTAQGPTATSRATIMEIANK